MRIDEPAGRGGVPRPLGISPIPAVMPGHKHERPDLRAVTARAGLPDVGAVSPFTPVAATPATTPSPVFPAGLLYTGTGHLSGFLLIKAR